MSVREVETKAGAKRWEVRLRFKGCPEIKRHFTKKTVADRWETRTKADYVERQLFPIPEGKSKTLSEAVTRYKKAALKSLTLRTQDTDGARLDWWAARLGAELVANVTPDMIGEALDSLISEGSGKARAGRRAGGVSPTTAAHYLKTLRRLFNLLVKEWGWLRESPVAKVRKPKPSPGRVRYLTDEERARLLETCRESPSPYLYPMVLLALSTGARYGEVAGLRWKQVDIEKGIITLSAAGTKSRRGRALPLTPEAAAELQRIKASRVLVSDLVFPRVDNPTRPVGSLKTAWGKACRRAGLSDFRFHDLRHDCASRLVMAGLSLNVVAEVLGHRSLAMTQRYAHLKPGHAVDEARRILSGGQGRGKAGGA